MSLNLIEIAREHLSDDMLKLIADKVGLDPNQASGVVGKAFPSLLALFGERAKSDEGGEAIFNSVIEADTGILDNLTDSFSGDTSALQERGKGILNGIFGEDKLPSISNKIGLVSGISEDKAEGVLGMLTPYLSSLLGKQVKQEGLELSGFQNMLNSQEGAIKGVLGNNLDKLGFAGLAAGLGGAFTGASAGVTNALGSIEDKVTDTADGISDKVSGSINSVGDKVTEVTDGISDKVSGSINSVEDKVTEVTGGISDKVSGSINSVGDKVTEVTDDIGEKVSGSINSVGDKVTEVSDGIGEKVSGSINSVGDKVTDTADGIGEKVSGSINSVEDKVAEVTDGISDKVSGSIDSVQDKVGSVVSGVGASAESAPVAAEADVTSPAQATSVNKGGGGFKWLFLLLIPILVFILIRKCNPGEVVKEVGGAVSDGTKAVSSAVVDTTKSTGEVIGDSAKSVTDSAVSGIDSASEALSDGASALGDAADAVTDGVSAAGDEAKAIGEGALDGIKSIGTSITEGVENTSDAITEGTASLGEGAKSAGGAIVAGVKSLGDTIADGAAAASEAVTDGANTAGNAIAAGATAAGEAVTNGASIFGVPTDGPQLSEKVKGFASKLSSIDSSDESKLDEVYSEFTADGSSGFLYRIPFSTGETGVPSSHQEALVAKLKTAKPNATLVTIGYADVRGDDAQNKQLSYGRAKEVGEWITTTLGSDRAIESFSMGETDRFSKTDYSKNRVVEVWQVTE